MLATTCRAVWAHFSYRRPAAEILLASISRQCTNALPAARPTDAVDERLEKPPWSWP